MDHPILGSIIFEFKIFLLILSTNHKKLLPYVVFLSEVACHGPIQTCKMRRSPTLITSIVMVTLEEPCRNLMCHSSSPTAFVSKGVRRFLKGNPCGPKVGMSCPNNFLG